MELLKLSSKKTKIWIIGILTILILGYNSPVYAVIYHFDDDFSNDPSDKWIFKSYNRTSQPFQAVDHSFVTENGELVSSGADNGFSTNTAFIQDNTAFGAWSFDLYIPSTAEHDKFFNRLTAILMSELEMGPPSIEPNSTFYSSFGLFIEKGVLEFQAHNGTSNLLAGLRQETTFQEVDKSQRYDIIRTEDRFFLFIDSNVILNVTFSSAIGASINYFTINVGTGSNLRFDNIKITTDAQGVLDSIVDVSETNNPSSSSETSSDSTSTPVSPTPSASTNDSLFSASTNDSLFYAAGTGIVALTGTVSYWQLSKKKI